MYEDFVGGVQFWGYGLVSGSGDGAVRMWDSTSSISASFLINNFVNAQSANWTSPSNTLRPYRIEAEEGLMMFKLRCRKFVELILEAVEIEQTIKPKSYAYADVCDCDSEMVDGMDLGDDMSMDIDDGFSNGVSMSAAERSVARYEKSLSEAIAYGQSLQADYKADHRPEVKGTFKKTFGILAWDDPLEAGGTAAEVVGIEARIELANELNE